MVEQYSFRNIALEEDYEYHLFVEAADAIILNPNLLNEGFLDKAKSFLKSKFDFVQNLAKTLGVEFIELLKLFKDKYIFGFFKKIGWSIKKLIVIVKKGYNAYNKVIKIISEYINNSKIGSWTDEKIKELDEFLINHPYIKRIGGLVVAGLLIWIWYSMAFSGRPDSDFDNVAIFDALTGKFTLSDIFAGPNGVEFLSLLVIGLMGASFPYPGSNAHIKFIGSLLYSAAKRYNLDKKLSGLLTSIKI